MIGILRLLAGPRFCPWCSLRGYSIGDRITDRLPVRVVVALSPYDRLVGRLAVPLHQRLNESATGSE